VLEYGGLLTQKEIASESYLPPRTVRYALNRLRREQLLEERFYFKDARQSLYGLKINIHHPATQTTTEDAKEQVLIP
jgi:transcription initiation factor IIE alpha subunit